MPRPVWTHVYKNNDDGVPVWQCFFIDETGKDAEKWIAKQENPDLYTTSNNPPPKRGPRNATPAPDFTDKALTKALDAATKAKGASDA